MEKRTCPVIAPPTQELRGVLTVLDKTALRKILKEKMRLRERGCLWNPVPLSLKMRTFLDSKHLIHTACAGDAVRFSGR